MSAIEKAVSRLGKKAKPELSTAATSQAVAGSVAQRVVEQGDFAANIADFDLGEQTAEVLQSSTEVRDAPETAEVTAPKETAPGKQITLPVEKMSHEGFIAPDNPRSQIAEEYRSIKRPLLIRADQSMHDRVDNANVLMVTSSIQGEGKTFTAINLALSMAMERDKTVLFIDTDIITASAGAVFGLPVETPGLVDVLTGNAANVADVIVRTDIPNLRIVPAGKPHDHAAELLASSNMKNLVRDLADKYPNRMIIFDSPPLLQTNEARILATLAGQIVFVVAANSTSQSNVTEALSHLNKDKPVGLLLNRSFNSANDGYGYNYGSYAAATS